MLNFFLASSLAVLWGLLNSLQLIVHLPLFAISIPENVKRYYVVLYDLATFDIVPSESIYSFLDSLFSNSSDGEDFNLLGAYDDYDSNQASLSEDAVI